ncbi:uncharacterized protein ppp1r3c2a isoform X2 [Sparus aurata]|uniref:uncharacterized protein ppp1r3c2a isoform X2 n=1 Tax=Sparus aurata TaxID=8175 RepID=UPI0011C18EB1|nr:uncharacterized protein LOC115592345 isoform X2 [Sparus aurata]
MSASRSVLQFDPRDPRGPLRALQAAAIFLPVPVLPGLLRFSSHQTSSPGLLHSSAGQTPSLNMCFTNIPWLRRLLLLVKHRHTRASGVPKLGNLMMQNGKREAIVTAMTDAPLPSSGAARDSMGVSAWRGALLL